MSKTKQQIIDYLVQEGFYATTSGMFVKVEGDMPYCVWYDWSVNDGTWFYESGNRETCKATGIGDIQRLMRGEQ